MNKPPLILLINDDGVFSPGLAALCEAVSPFGELLVVAPNGQQTSTGRAYTQNKDGGIIKKVSLETRLGTFPAYSVAGTPASCAAHAVLELAGKLPDICISGINYGENLGKTLTYSGTIGAALQAADFGIPSLALSRPVKLEQIHTEAYPMVNWELSKAVARFWVKKVLEEGMPYHAPILNINVPEKTCDCKNHAFTFQSNNDIFCYQKPKPRDFSQPFTLPSFKNMDFSQAEPGSDIYTVWVENRVSVTPIAGNYTHWPAFEKHP